MTEEHAEYYQLRAAVNALYEQGLTPTEAARRVSAEFGVLYCWIEVCRIWQQRKLDALARACVATDIYPVFVEME